MIKFIDFLFWHYYCFANRHKKIYWGDNVWQAIGMIYGTMIVPIVLIYKIIDLFIVNLPNLSGPGHIDSLIIMGVVSLPIFLFLNNRYYHNQKIIKDNFRIFRERWGDDPRQSKKRQSSYNHIYNYIFLWWDLFGNYFGRIESSGFIRWLPLDSISI